MAVNWKRFIPTLGRKNFTIARDTGSGSRNTLYPSVSDRDANNNSVIMAAAFWAMRNVPLAGIEHQVQTEDGWKANPESLLSELINAPQGRLAPEIRSGLNRSKMMQGLVLSRMFDGNGYLHKVRNGSGQVIALDYIPHTAVNVVLRQDSGTVIDRYEVSTSKGVLRIDREDMIHMTLGIDPENPAIGLSPLKSIMRQVMTDNEIAIYCHSIIRNPFPGLILSPKEGMRITQDDADAAARSIQAKASGERAGGIVVQTVGMNVDPMRLSPDQMSIDKLNTLPEQRICSVIGIPPIVLQLGSGLEQSTYSNMKEAREAAAEEFQVPFWRDLCECLTESLVPDFTKKNNERVFYTTDHVRALQEDDDKFHERVRKDFESNLINRAEARTEFGRKPEPGDEKVYAYMLKPSPAAPIGAQGPKMAQEARAKAEGI